MNERLEKLAEQAGFKNVVGVLDGKVELQKFAELVVRECADIATINQFQWNSAGTYVLKHFGVKE